MRIRSRYLLVSLPGLAAAGFLLFEAQKDREIASREQTTLGKIISHEPAGRNRFTYHFAVEGREFTGSYVASLAQPEVGEFVSVYYDPHNPAANSLVSFSRASKRESFYAIGLLVVTLIVTMAALLLGAWLGRTARKNLLSTVDERKLGERV